MASYRGIDQREIRTSISDALAFMQRHPAGPAMQKSIAKITPQLLKDISNAHYNENLVDVIRDSGIARTFACLSLYFCYHQHYNTDGVGSRIRDNLTRWGGFESMVPMRTALDAELDAYVAAGIAATPADIPFDVKAIKQSAVTSPVRIYMLVIPPKRTIEVDATTPRYIVDNRAKLQKSADESHAESRVYLHESVARTLIPFERMDEASRILLGSFPVEGHPHDGVCFRGTRVAVQAVADRHPGFKVVNLVTGNVTPPNLPGNRAAPRGYTPGPHPR